MNDAKINNTLSSKDFDKLFDDWYDKASDDERLCYLMIHVLSKLFSDTGVTYNGSILINTVDVTELILLIQTYAK